MLCLWLAIGARTTAAPPALQAQPLRALIVVLLPGTSLHDWQGARAPHLHALLAQGAVAVMNTRTARTGSDKQRETPWSACLTLGSGSRAAGAAQEAQWTLPGQVLLTDGVTAGQLYARRMGRTVPPGAWLNADWPRLLADNTGRGYDIRLGSMADGLAAQGVAVAAGGGPYAYPVACDGAGTVRVVNSLALPQVGASCVVWDAGGDAAQADETIGAAMEVAHRAHGQVWVVSPFVSDAQYRRGARLAPVVVWGAGVAAGELYSRSTRRVGLVTNTDFAPSVASYFGALLPVQAYGQAWTARPMEDAPRQVGRLQAQAYRQARAMRVLPGVAVALGVWILACSVGLWRGRRLFGLGVVPAAVLCALLLGGSVGECAAWLCALGVAAGVGTRFAGAGRTVALLCVLIVCVLAVDLASGDMLMRRSVLGYSAVEGARYYGIGNEAMGLLVGAAVCLVWAVWPTAKSVWARGAVGTGLAAITALLALPGFGAKAGSVFVAVPSFGVLLWTLSGRRAGRWLVPMLALLTLCAMAGVVLLDRHTGAGQSHVGQAAARIGQGGLRPACDVVARKASVEGHLLTHSAWAAALWGATIGLVLLGRRMQQAKHLQALLTAGAVAGATCVLFNDAGTVAGALCLAVLWSMAAAQTEH